MESFLSNLFGYAWTPEKDMPSLEGRTIVVTGGTDGIGKETIARLALHNPSRIWMAARNETKAKTTIAEITRVHPKAHISFVNLDLTSFTSIKSAAATITSQSTHLHTLILNAGVWACPPGLTEDGYELLLGTNFLGHALFAQLLLPFMRETAKLHAAGPDDPTKRDADVRVVSVSSHSESEFVNERGIHFEDLKMPNCGGMSPFYRYGQSKLAMVLYARALAEREEEIRSGVRSLVCHPGTVKSNIVRGFVEIHPWLSIFIPLVRWLVVPPFMLTLYEGCKSTLWTAISPEAKNGVFYYPVGKEVPGSEWSQDVELRGRLWEWTQKELAEHL